MESDIKTERCAGGVLYTKENGTIKYLLIISKKGYYGFPKGHIEEGEDPATAGAREVKEEANIDCSFDNDFHAEAGYMISEKKNTYKHIDYYLSYFDNHGIAFQYDEIKGGVLVTYEEGLNLIKILSVRDVLIKANNYIVQHGL